ncbi:hypothetical protein ACI68E_003543 [Malassezia pachydermatis]|uniref:Set domain-containing protein n=1 Tax=Malassezia pachydermatis TaxID=77020 RepID=A0A0M9VNI3_9BASI|nr:set domain-containing protein [Malassezia pachydermatis]KOS13383.1 set domain-containing protein [Malassezia pachydermatis]
MAFQALRARRDARQRDWRRRSTEAPTHACQAIPGTSLEVEVTTLAGRGLRLSPQAAPCQPGDTLAEFPTSVSVLATSQVPHRCHFCFSKPDHALVRCSRCHFARYCGAQCQAAAWTDYRHRDECHALRRWFRTAEHPDTLPDLAREPGPSVRALAQLLWRRQRQDAAWWQPHARMISHRTTLDAASQEEAASIAYRLAQFLGSEGTLRALGIEHADALLELVCQHRANGFTLSDPHLDPIGVCIQPTAALLNHACEPNAVVVFPEAKPGHRCRMHILALQPIQPGDAVLTSYVDVATPHAERQRILRERYHFTCRCALCTRHDSWIDPRTALWCPHTGCVGWVSPTAPSACRQCHRVPGAMDVQATLAQAQEAALHVEKAMASNDLHTIPSYVAISLPGLSAIAPPSHHLMWTLLHAAQVVAIEKEAWDEAISYALLLCAGMQARGARDARSCLYIPGHPQRAVLLATLGRLLAQSTSDTPPTASAWLARPPPIPPSAQARREMAWAILQQAQHEALVGFGRATQGGTVGHLVRATLHVLSQEQEAARTMCQPTS